MSKEGQKVVGDNGLVPVDTAETLPMKARRWKAS